MNVRTETEAQPPADSGEPPLPRTRRWPRRTLIVLVAAALVCTLALLFGIPGPLHRHSAADLIALRDRINEVCGTTHGPARIDWVAGRVNYPNGTPQLTDDENQMLGSGPKIGCVSEAIR